MNAHFRVPSDKNQYERLLKSAKLTKEQIKKVSEIHEQMQIVNKMLLDGSW
jgi:hypothetical protein